MPEAVKFLILLAAMVTATFFRRWCLAIIAFYVFLAVLAPLLTPYGESEVVGYEFEPWGENFLLGTDNLGRDMMTRLIYGDLRKRASSDNDIWVPREHFFEALERLEAAGYQPVLGLDSRSAVRRVGQVALWPGGDPDAVSLDLHVEPFSQRYFRIDEPLLLQNLDSVDLHGRCVQTFSPALALLHMVAHWIQHHFEERLLGDVREAWLSFGAELPRELPA